MSVLSRIFICLFLIAVFVFLTFLKVFLEFSLVFSFCLHLRIQTIGIGIPSFGWGVMFVCLNFIFK